MILEKIKYNVFGVKKEGEIGEWIQQYVGSDYITPSPVASIISAAYNIKIRDLLNLLVLNRDLNELIKLVYNY